MLVLYVQDWISGLIDTYTEELPCLNMKNKQPEKKLFHSYCRKIQESIEGINSTFLSRSVEGQSRTQLCDWPLTLILHSHKTNPIIPWWPCTLITFLVLVPILFPPRTLPNWWFTERWGIFCPRSKMTNIFSIAGTWSASSDN